MAKFIIPIPTTLSGLKVIFVLFLVVVAIVILLVSIKYCCLKCVCNCDDEEKQEAPAQLESVHSVQHGSYKSSNDQNWEHLSFHLLPILHKLSTIRSRLLDLVPAGNSYQIRHLRNSVSYDVTLHSVFYRN